MLSAKSVETVRATLPAVGGAVTEITDLFYRKLFDAHPELLRDLFNRGNQASGAQKQALAGAIAAFATGLVRHPEVRPDAMLTRIAHKHASLGITRDQYQVVHTHLFAAIVDVLGDAVTAEVAAAWDEVYWLMANALVAIEERLYAAAGAVDGSTWRAWEVVERTRETDDVATFRLRPVDDIAEAEAEQQTGGANSTFRPGQYVSVQVELPDGARQIRQYSLSGAPGAPTRTITVKRIRAAGTPDGEVSNHLHAHVRVGHRVTMSAAYGDLVLTDTPGPLVLISAGIGCTPILSMLDHLADLGHEGSVTVLHADRSPADHAMRADHEQLTAKLPAGVAHFWYESRAAEQPVDRPSNGRTDGSPNRPTDRAGRMDLTDIAIPTGAHAYLCGPLPFMRGIRTALIERGIPASDIHYEVFGPDLWLGGE
ncbi:globin domain-containing protein [Streptomyces sp. SID3343]|uniref:globin domain-containing protein n=1 Tax=Streptomyces sp. SID3343 TaxID=2690260 RepID=UPI0013691F76|nr:globin domain-containing protein [Streptomyces sp. SID3343]MYV99732.1 hemin transporter [Streptomyces sp. SID3343]